MVGGGGLQRTANTRKARPPPGFAKLEEKGHHHGVTATVAAVSEPPTPGWSCQRASRPRGLPDRVRGFIQTRALVHGGRICTEVFPFGSTVSTTEGGAASLTAATPATKVTTRTPPPLVNT